MLLAVPKTNTKFYGDRSFAAKAPRLWNALPVDIKNSESLDICKSKVRRLLSASAIEYHCKVSRTLLSLLLLLLLCIECKQY